MTEKQIVIEIKETSSGHPYIDMGPFGVLIFSHLTADPLRGYKWMAYNREYVDAISVKKASERKIIKVQSRSSAIFNMRFKRDALGKKGVPRGMLPHKLVKYLTNIFESLIDQDGYITSENIYVLDKILQETDFDDMLIPKPKRKYIRKRSYNRKASK